VYAERRAGKRWLMVAKQAKYPRGESRDPTRDCEGELDHGATSGMQPGMAEVPTAGRIDRAMSATPCSGLNRHLTGPVRKPHDVTAEARATRRKPRSD